MHGLATEVGGATLLLTGTQRLIDAIKSQAPQAQYFCVGDDWQAINGFAGSDLKYYSQFDQYFSNPTRIEVTTNYRSAQKIVETGNSLMRNLGRPARASGLFGDGEVVIGNLGEFQPTPSEEEEYSGDIITPAILRLVNYYTSLQKSVLLLSRANTLPWYVNKGNSLEAFLKSILSRLPENQAKLVKISTAHKSKGQQEHTVILLDVLNRRYPLIHPDFIFTRIFGDSVTSITEEERRLFYVALTRAKENLILITEMRDISPFLREISHAQYLGGLFWQAYDPILGSVERVTVRVKNQVNSYGDGGTFAIKSLLRAQGYAWQSQNKLWQKTVAAKDFSVDKLLNESIWLSQAHNVEITFSNDYDQVFESYLVNGGKPCSSRQSEFIVH